MEGFLGAYKSGQEMASGQFEVMKAMKTRELAKQYQLGSPQDRQAILGQIAQYDPQQAQFLQQQQVAQQQQQQQKAKIAGQLASTVLKADPKNRPAIYKATKKIARERYGLDDSQLPEEWTQEIEPYLQSLQDMSGLGKEQIKYGAIPEGQYLDTRTGQLKTMGGYQKQMAEKPPTGYQWTPQGTLEPIAGGPATKLSEIGAKTLAITEQGEKSLNELETNIEELGGIISKSTAFSPNIFQKEKQQKYNVLVNDLSDSIGRLRSGGAINTGEEERFKKLLPKFGDKPKTIEFKIERLRENFKKVSSNIERGKVVGQKKSIVKDPLGIR